MESLPILDVSPLSQGGSEADKHALGAAIRAACRECGFFYIVGHSVDAELIARLQDSSREFFGWPAEKKRTIEMARGGRAWRGYFGVGDELTSGKPDWKEGLYFGAELSRDDPRVVAGRPLHGPNLFPDDLSELRSAVLSYIDAMTTLGHQLMAGFALGLGLEADALKETLTSDPLVLFRIFHYPEMGAKQIEEALWSVGEHTDYGLLTILLQDDVGGLEVKSRGEWVAAPPVPDSFVCNIGDMLDRITGGFYRSTPHRVLNRSGRSRFSFPFFFDPGWDVVVQPIDPTVEVQEDAEERWDRQSVHQWQGTYGEYLLSKVGKVFPDLRSDVLDS